ncbi:MAG: response regulator [Thermodesulfobacteriota bacterium]
MISKRSYRILVVDDDTAIRRLCRDALEGAGYEVGIAMNGSEALEKLEQGTYDLVISDVDMPVIGGVELFNRVIKLYGYLKDRFIFITGNPTLAHISRLAGLNANYFIKPFKVSSLLDRVDSLVGGNVYSEEGESTRRERRYPWQQDCFITEEALNIPIYSQTVDISSMGLKIRYSGRPFTPESSLRVFIKQQGIRAKGVIRWSRPLNTRESVAGLEFAEPLPSSSVEVLAMDGP